MSVPHPAIGLLMAAAAAACVGRVSGSSTYAVDRCPLPAGGVGYPVAARPGENIVVDTTYLRSVVRSVTDYWVPNRERRPRPQTEAEAWAVLRMPRQVVRPRDGWRPSADQRAEVRLVIRRDGTIGTPRLVVPSGRAAFDRSILAAITTAAAARDQGRVAHDTLPRTTPAGVQADSIAITLTFGAEPREGDVVVRYAVSERRVAPRPGSYAPRYPELERNSGREGDVLVQFIVGADGTVVPGSARVLRTSGEGFTQAVLEVLPGFQFVAAEIDCRPIPQLVQMPFAFRLTRPGVSGVARP